MNADTSPFQENEATTRRTALWFLYPIGLAAAVSALYLYTLYPGVGGETDSAKWQFVGKVFGVPHTTGYPLYILVSHIFSLLPVGTLAWRINFMSAFFAVLAVVLLQRILSGLLRSEILAVGGALVLAVLPMFWTFAVVAGVYSLNAFFICLVTYLLFKWADMVRGGGGGRGYFYAALFAYALSLGNHVTMITMLPALAVFALLTDWRAVLNLKTLVLSGLFVLIAAALYVLPFIQTALHAPYLEHRVRTLGDLWQLVSAAGFRQHLFVYGATGFAETTLPFYVSQVLAQFLPVGLCFAFAGMFLLAWRNGRRMIFAAMFLCVNLFMALNYYVNPAQLWYQFIPSYIVLALFVGFLPKVVDALAPRTDETIRLMWSGLVLLVLVGLAGFIGMRNLPQIQERQRQMAANDRIASDVIDALPDDAVILATSYNDSMILMYKMLGEERGAGKRWRVLHETSWKIPRGDAAAAQRMKPGEGYDVSAVERLLRGEKVDWSPLALEESKPVRHAVYFWGTDKALLDAVGYKSERVHLKGDGSGEDRYGGGTVELYRITEPPQG